jgi:tartronate-semialdehyde synthase
METVRTPVVVEITHERATHIAMGTELDDVVECEDRAKDVADAPTAIALLDQDA